MDRRRKNRRHLELWLLGNRNDLALCAMRKLIESMNLHLVLPRSVPLKMAWMATTQPSLFLREGNEFNLLWDARDGVVSEDVIVARMYERADMRFLLYILDGNSIRIGDAKILVAVSFCETITPRVFLVGDLRLRLEHSLSMSIDDEPRVLNFNQNLIGYAEMLTRFVRFNTKSLIEYWTGKIGTDALVKRLVKPPLNITATSLKVEGKLITINVVGDENGEFIADLKHWPELIARVGGVKNLQTAKLYSNDTILIGDNTHIEVEDIIEIAREDIPKVRK